jgi:hypothetical protein
MDHEAGEEEPHEQRRLQVDGALERLRGAGEAQEEQEAADEERRVVGS